MSLFEHVSDMGLNVLGGLLSTSVFNKLSLYYINYMKPYWRHLWKGGSKDGVYMFFQTFIMCLNTKALSRLLNLYNNACALQDSYPE